MTIDIMYCWIYPCTQSMLWTERPSRCKYLKTANNLGKISAIMHEHLYGLVSYRIVYHSVRRSSWFMCVLYMCNEYNTLHFTISSNIFFEFWSVKVKAFVVSCNYDVRVCQCILLSHKTRSSRINSNYM